MMMMWSCDSTSRNSDISSSRSSDSRVGTCPLYIYIYIYIYTHTQTLAWHAMVGFRQSKKDRKNYIQYIARYHCMHHAHLHRMHESCELCGITRSCRPMYIVLPQSALQGIAECITEVVVRKCWPWVESKGSTTFDYFASGKLSAVQWIRHAKNTD